MKKQLLIKTSLLLVGLLGGGSYSWVTANANTIPGAENAAVTLDLSNATITNVFSGSNASINGSLTDNFKTGDYLTFNLTNNTQQRYTLSFIANSDHDKEANRSDASKPSVVTMQADILSSTDAVMYSYQWKIRSNGNWSSGGDTYSWNIPQLEASTSYKLKVTFRAENNRYNYTANAGSFTLTPFDGTVDVSSSTDGTALSFTSNDITKASGENKANVADGHLDYFYSNDFVTKSLNLPSDANYAITFNYGTIHSNVSLKFSLIDDATGVESEESVWECENNGAWTYTSKSGFVGIANQTSGYKTLKIVFLQAPGSTTANVGNIKIGPAPTEALNENSNYTPAPKYANVTLTRTIAADKWSTIVLPFAMTSEQITTTFGEGTHVAQLTGYDSRNDKLLFTTATSMTANEPYLIKVANAFSSATISGVNILEGTPSKTTISGVDFIGSYEATTDIPYSDGSNSYYFISNNALYQTAESGTHDTMKGTRAYFKVPGTTAARQLSFSIDDETTGIHDAVKREDEKGSGVYDLQGRRVAQPTKGLYILNGKKVVIK